MPSRSAVREEGATSAAERPPAPYLEAALDSATDGILLIDPDGRLAYASERARAFLRREPGAEPDLAELLVERVDRHEFERGMSSVLSAGQPRVDVRVRFIRGDGSRRWTAVSMTAVPGGAHVAAVLRDVHDDVVRARVREEETRRFLRAVDGVGDVLLRCRPDDTITWVSQTGATFGLTTQVSPGAPPARFQSDDADSWRGAKKVASSGAPARTRVRLTREDGRPCWVEVVVTAVLDDGGTVAEFVAVLRDVQHQVENQQRRSRREERYVRALESGPVAVLFLDSTGRITWASTPAHDVLHRCWDDIRGRRLADVVCGDTLANVPEDGVSATVLVPDATGAGHPVQLLVRRLDPTDDDEPTRVVFLSDPAGVAGGGGQKPPSTQKLGVDMFHTALNALEEAVLVLSPVSGGDGRRDFHVDFANDAGVRMFHTGRSGLVGRLVRDAHPWFERIGLLSVFDEAMTRRSDSIVMAPSPTAANGSPGMLRLRLRSEGGTLVVMIRPYSNPSRR